MFFRKIGYKLSKIISQKQDNVTIKDPRVTPWNLGNEDFNYILRHSKKMRIMNIDELTDMRNIAELYVLTKPNIRLLLPYGDHMINLEYENNSYAFPYVIVSERERDCRLFVFESVQDLMRWMEGLREDMDLDKWNRKFLRCMRVFRLMFNGGELLVEGSTAINDIIMDTKGWSKPGTHNKLTQCIIKPIAREGIPVLKPHLLMLPYRPSFILDRNGYFIKDWRYNEK